MSDWIHNLPVGWTGAVVFGGTYLVTALIFLVILGSAKGERLRTYKSVSPGLLPPLGMLFGLLVAFLAAQVWGDVDRANTAVNREASALRAVVLLSTSIAEQPGRQLRDLIRHHIHEAQTIEWPAMGRKRQPDDDSGAARRSAAEHTDTAPGECRTSGGAAGDRDGAGECGQITRVLLIP